MFPRFYEVGIQQGRRTDGHSIDAHLGSIGIGDNDNKAGLFLRLGDTLLTSTGEEKWKSMA